MITTTGNPPSHNPAELYREHAADLQRAVRRAVVASDAIVEDACQFAWMQLVRLRPPHDPVFGWLRTTAVREAWRLCGLERHDVSLDLPTGGRGAGSIVELVPGPALELQIEAREALRAVAALRAKPRHALARQIAGLSYEEIQQEAGLTFRQVDRHLVRARAALRT